MLVYIQTTASLLYLKNIATNGKIPLRVLLVFGALFGASIIWYYNLPAEELPTLWIENIKKTCPDLKEFESPRLKTFKKLLFSNILIGILIGNWID